MRMEWCHVMKRCFKVQLKISQAFRSQLSLRFLLFYLFIFLNAYWPFGVIFFFFFFGDNTFSTTVQSEERKDGRFRKVTEDQSEFSVSFPSQLSPCMLIHKNWRMEQSLLNRWITPWMFRRNVECPYFFFKMTIVE